MTRCCGDCGYPFHPLAGHHRWCRACWLGRNDPSGYRPSPSPGAVSAGLDARAILEAIMLCHPDRHPVERREMATRVTQVLTAALELARELE